MKGMSSFLSDSLDMKKKIRGIWPTGIAIITLVMIYISNYNNLNCLAVFNDEFGYWGNAATIAGWNWNELLALTPYYSIGYSLMLVPLFKLGLTSVQMYRIAILMNMGFIFISYLCAVYIANRLFPHNTIWLNQLIGFAAAMSGPTLFYSQIGWCEVFLMMLMWGLTAVFVRIEQKFSYHVAAGIVLLSFYMYLTHQRTIAVMVLAFCLLLIICLYKKKTFTSIISMLLITLLLLGYRRLKTFHVDTVYSASTYSDLNNIRVTGSFIGGFLSKIQSNTKDIAISLMCKTGVLLMTTEFTLIIACRDLIISSIRKKPDYIVTKVFIVLSVFGMLALQTIQMFGSYRKDLVVYSRYMDFVLPMAALYGLGCLLQSYETNRKLFQFTILATIPLIILSAIQINNAENSLNPVCSSIWDAAVHYTGDNQFIRAGMIVCGFCMLYLILSVIIENHRGACRNVVLLFAILILNLSVYKYSNEKINMNRAFLYNSGADVCDFIQQDNNNDIFVYIKRNGNIIEGEDIIKEIQYNLFDHPIAVTFDINSLPNEAKIITNGELSLTLYGEHLEPIVINQPVCLYRYHSNILVNTE